MLRFWKMRIIEEPADAGITAPERGRPKGAGAGLICVDRRLLAVLSFLVAAIAVAHQTEDKHFDFGIFYYGAHMVLDGARHALYEPAIQRVFQVQFHRPAALLFCYPPFALIPFLGIAELPIEIAFVIWTIISLGLLILSVQTLARHAEFRYGNWPILFSLAFMPVASCLGHGQVSLVVLSAYVLAYSLWRRGRLFLGGAVLAIATLKFQLVIGFIAVLLLKRKWRELLGFATGSAMFGALSVAMVGLPTVLQYPVFLSHGGGDLGSEPDKMPNWRGLMSLVGADHTVIVAALSLLTILFAAKLWRDLDTGFVASIIAAMLVSYHSGSHDLCLFLIPAFLARNIGFPPKQLLRLALSALLLPEILAAFGGHYALLAIPLVLCLWWIRHDGADRGNGAIERFALKRADQKAYDRG